MVPHMKMYAIQCIALHQLWCCILDFMWFWFEGVCLTHVILTPVRVEVGSEQWFLTPLCQDCCDPRENYGRLILVRRRSYICLFG